MAAAQSPPSQCCEIPPVLNPSCGAGHVEETLGGLRCYVSGSYSTAAVILISDVYGFEAPNLRKLADKVAGAGYYVVAPDFFNADPYNPNNSGSSITEWCKVHVPDKGFEDAMQIIAALKGKGIQSIGAAGFCWGAQVVVRLGKVSAIQAAVLLHPSFVSLEDIQGMKVPISVLAAEFDKMSPPELVKEFGEILKAKPEVDSFVKIYEGVSHGWAVRYNCEDEKAVRSAEEAHSQMLLWFSRFLTSSN